MYGLLPQREENGNDFTIFTKTLSNKIMQN